MSEEEKIEEVNSKSEMPNANEELANENISQEEMIAQPETENTKQETENMEVHHHPHVEKKNFKEYLLEGLMIFLAVTMGFIAESIRETLSDKEKEKQYIESFVQNLEDDTTDIGFTIRENELKLKMLDSLIHLSLKDVTQPANRIKLYSYCFRFVGRYSIFKSNDATMLQLTNSGGLRVIQKDHVADSIAKYANDLKFIYAAEDVYTNGMNAAINATQEFLDYSTYYDTVYFKNNFTGATLPLLTTDPKKIKFFFNKIEFEIGATRNYINNLTDRLPYVQQLIAFLKREYDIE